MSETVAEQLDAGSSDASPGPSMDETMEAAYDAHIAAENAPEGAAPAEATEVAKEPERAPDAAPAPVSAPTVPDYLAPYVSEFANRGIRPEDGVKNLLQTWTRLETAPEATLKWLAGQYGVEWGGARQAAPAPVTAPEDQEWVDPAIVALRHEVAELKSRDQTREQAVQMAQQNAYQQAFGAVQTEIQSFADTKAKADGVDFDALRPTMAALIQSGQAKDLEDAYEQAVWATPATRTVKIEAERKQQEVAATKATAERAAAARRAGSVNVRSDTAGTGRGSTIEETMARAYDEAFARG